MDLFTPGRLDPTKRRRTFSGNYKEMHGIRRKSVGDGLKNGANEEAKDLMDLNGQNILPQLSANGVKRASEVIVKVGLIGIILLHFIFFQNLEFYTPPPPVSLT